MNSFRERVVKLISDGRAIAQAVSRWPLTTEAQARARVSHFVIFFLQNPRFCPVSIITPLISILMYHVGVPC
jgi:hypothetical protein